MVNRGSPFRLIVPSWIARSFRFNACLNYRANRTASFVSESPPFRNTRKNGRIFDTDPDIQPEEKVSSETVVAPRNRASSPIVRESTLLRHVGLSSPLLSSRVVYSRTRNNSDIQPSLRPTRGGRRGATIRFRALKITT